VVEVVAVSEVFVDVELMEVAEDPGY